MGRFDRSSTACGVRTSSASARSSARSSSACSRGGAQARGNRAAGAGHDLPRHHRERAPRRSRASRRTQRGGLPDDLQFEAGEPLKMLFKDEVRACGGRWASARLVYRQPFPAPGWASVPGAITRERLEIVAKATHPAEEFDNRALPACVAVLHRGARLQGRWRTRPRARRGIPGHLARRQHRGRMTAAVEPLPFAVAPHIADASCRKSRAGRRALHLSQTAGDDRMGRYSIKARSQWIKATENPRS